MSQTISSGSGAAMCSTKSHWPSGNLSSTRSTSRSAFSWTYCSTRADLLRREALRHDRAQTEVLRIVHVDHRAEELVHLLREIADVRALPGAEQRGVAAHGPDVLVAGERVVTGARREREALDHTLVVELQAGRVAERLEGAFAERSVGGPELEVGQVEVVERDRRQFHATGSYGRVPGCVTYRAIRLGGPGWGCYRG